VILEVIDTDSTSSAVVPSLDFGNFQVVSYIAFLTCLSMLSVTLRDSNPWVDKGTCKPSDIEINHDHQVHIKVQFTLFRSIQLEQQVNGNHVDYRKADNKEKN
jgi:hypothetical protein